MADALTELEDALGLTPTPTATPTPAMTPVAASEPGFLDRLRGTTYSMPEPFRSLTSAGLAIAESPRAFLEEGASIGGSVVGGTAGTALGGPVGGILGSALGSYADVPIQIGLDYLLGTTPQTSRIGQATKEAGLGAAIETGLQGLGYLGKLNYCRCYWL